ncbi:hypothetical protein QN277_006196 [Acacia crassicarpa]|nr:hypothetical protein QN277_006196 [Acacia crassicarpa]
MQVREVQKAPLMDYFARDAAIVFTSNGLVCVKFDNHASCGSPPRLLLWNPATRDKGLVPTNINDFGDQFSWNKIFVGFGFSPIINDYKIVMFRFSYRAVDWVELYSLTSESWKEVKCGTLAGLMNLWDQTVTANGVMYWFGWLERHGSRDVTIVSFDIANEVFTLIPSPDFYPSPYSSTLTVHEDRLAVLSLNRYQSKSIDLWVMDEAIGSSRGIRSWTKKYTCVFSSYCFVCPLTIWRNEIFCSGVHERPENVRLEPALFNLTTNKIKLGFMDTLCNLGHHVAYKYHAFNYVESLVPIGGTKF